MDGDCPQGEICVDGGGVLSGGTTCVGPNSSTDDETGANTNSTNTAVPATCSINGGCPGDDSICDHNSGECVARCTGDDDCGPDVCVVDSGLCQQCLVDTDCDGASVCAGDGRCVECVQDGDCAGTSAPYCNSEKNLCVQCTEASHCSSGEVCDTDNAQCVGCIGDQDCDDGVCHQQSCVECVVDDDCDGTQTCSGNTCSGDVGGTCWENLDCTIDGEICENQSCVENPDTSFCREHSDCPFGYCHEIDQDCECDDDDDCSTGQSCCYFGDYYCADECICDHDSDCYLGQSCCYDEGYDDYICIEGGC